MTKKSVTKVDPEEAMNHLKKAMETLETVAEPWPEANQFLLPGVNKYLKRVETRAKAAYEPIALSQIKYWRENMSIYTLAPRKVLTFRTKTRLLRVWLSVLYIRLYLLTIILAGVGIGLILAVLSSGEVILEIFRKLVMSL